MPESGVILYEEPVPESFPEVLVTKIGLFPYGNVWEYEKKPTFS
jgi:hypothetical protein